MTDPRRRGLRPGLVLVGALAAVHVAVSLYPGHWDPPRRVRNGAVRSDGAVTFEDDGVVTFVDDAVTIPGSVDDGDIVVEVVATSAGSQDGPARILVLSRGTRSQSLVIGQARNSLVVRVRRDGSDEVGRPALVVPDVFADAEPHRIAVRLSADELEIRVDGRLRAREMQPRDPVRSWPSDHRFVLGNEHGGTRPWLGRLDRVTVVTPVGRTDLLAMGSTPGHFWRLPDRWNAANAWDPWAPRPVQWLHGASLVAIGAVAAGLSRWRPRNVLVGCWLLSAGVFLAKFVAGGRHPSLADLVVEGVGATVGVAVGTIVAMWRG